MRLDDAPKEGMVCLNINPFLLLRWNLLLVFNRFDNPRNGCASKTEKQYFLTWAQVAISDLRCFDNRNSGFSGARSSCNKKVTLGFYKLQLFLSELHPYLLPVRFLPIRVPRCLLYHWREQVRKAPSKRGRLSVAILVFRFRCTVRENQQQPNRLSFHRNSQSVQLALVL